MLQDPARGMWGTLVAVYQWVAQPDLMLHTGDNLPVNQYKHPLSPLSLQALCVVLSEIRKRLDLEYGVP